MLFRVLCLGQAAVRHPWFVWACWVPNCFFGRPQNLLLPASSGNWETTEQSWSAFRLYSWRPRKLIKFRRNLFAVCLRHRSQPLALSKSTLHTLTLEEPSVSTTKAALWSFRGCPRSLRLTYGPHQCRPTKNPPMKNPDQFLKASERKQPIFLTAIGLDL